MKDYDNDYYDKIKYALNGNNSRAKNNIYDIIIVDEIQDFYFTWQKNILAFLAQHGTLIYCGDIKQNIYNSKNDYFLLPSMNLTWYEMHQSFRTPSIITDLANQFSSSILHNDTAILPRQLELFSEKQPHIEYHELKDFDYDFIWHKILQCKNYVSEYNNEKEIIVLFENTLRLRHIEQHIQEVHPSITSDHKFNLETTFESQDTFINLCKECLKQYTGQKEELKQAHMLFLKESKNNPSLRNIDFDLLSESEERCCERCLKSALYKIRKGKKKFFHMYNGSYKLTTIHSFKGWELKNVILILDGFFDTLDDIYSEDNLIYTAITRAKTNLIIINIGNKKYTDFFVNHLSNQENSTIYKTNSKTIISISISVFQSIIFVLCLSKICLIKINCPFFWGGIKL